MSNSNDISLSTVSFAKGDTTIDADAALDAQILTYLRAHPNRSTREVAQALTASHGEVQSAMCLMVFKGVIEETGRPVPPSGERRRPEPLYSVAEE